MSSETKRSLVTKLAEVMGLVTRIPKSGRNNFHNYDYATEADIVAAVRSEMAARHLMLMPSVEKTEWRDIPTKNGSERLCTLTVKFALLDGDSGERMEFCVLGEGQDRGDKATYKAMTGATKYALLKLFLIPTGDDPEQDAPAAPPPRTAPKATAAKTTTAPAAQSKPAGPPPTNGQPKTSAEAKKVLEAKLAVVNGTVELPKVADPRSIWDRCVSLGREAGMDSKAVGLKLKELTGKPDWKALTEDDVKTFGAWLDDDPDADAMQQSEPPPMTEEQAPF